MMLLSARDIRASYDRMEAVGGGAIDVPPGSIVSLIGANGAGKTTLLSALMGLMPASGSILYEGREIREMTAEERVGLGISLVSEKRDLFGSMSVEDNLLTGGYLQAAPQRNKNLCDVFQRFPRLEERRTQFASTLSGGERQMLAMGRALMASPRLLLLDEPSLGLAPLITRTIFSIITTLRRDGISILLVEQNARAALQVSDRAYVMELGKITREGESEQLMHDPRLIEAYLGFHK